MLIAVAAIGFGIGLRLLPLSLYTAMGPVVIWAFGSALVIPGATTAALAGFPKVAGAALLFSDSLTALETVMPGMALLAILAHVVLPSKHERRLFAVAPEELETGVDPAGAVGAGGEEIERVVHQGNR